MQERRQAAWIGGSVWVKGNVVSRGDLIIDGKVEGSIELADHSLTIGESATVVADLVARSVTISGKVEGTNVTWAHKSDSEGGTVTVSPFMKMRASTQTPVIRVGL